MLLFSSELGMAWASLGISLGLRPWEIPWETHAMPRSDAKSITPLYLIAAGTKPAASQLAAVRGEPPTQSEEKNINFHLSLRGLYSSIVQCAMCNAGAYP